MTIQFKTWEAVLAYCETHEYVWYHAPLDRRPVRVRIVRVFKNRKIRIDPITNEADNFTADSGHLPRFSYDLGIQLCDVRAELLKINAIEVCPDGPECGECEGIDVRLQVIPYGNAFAWSVRYGDASCDTDHSGYWGASSVPGNGETFDAWEVARALIDEATEAASQDC